jgi:beta-xylosidase
MLRGKYNLASLSLSLVAGMLAAMPMGQTRTVHVTDVAKTAPAYAGYLFTYFTGEGTANGEQIHFALSQGNDPLHWQQLNNGNPTLVSTLGDKGVRDPFIIRSPDGGKFFLIATDLRIFGNGNWDAAQRTGSKSIVVWESTDLVNWTDQRLVKVSPDTAGNTWAPEAYYDDALGAYVLFWASKIYAADDPNHTGATYNKMMYATTRDFRTFNAPQVWDDPGYSVIDSTLIKHDGTYYRFTKDERNPSSSSPCSKFIIEEKSASILNPHYDFVAECLGRGAISRGEGPTVFKSNTEEKWYLFIDEFGGRGYVPFESTDLGSGHWTIASNYTLPASPRHGTVLPVTQAEYDRLLRAYQPDQLVERVDDVSVATGIGDAPVLPATVTAHYADGSSRPAAVTWDRVPHSAYASPAIFTVRGSLAPGVNIRARAQVTVRRQVLPGLYADPNIARFGDTFYIYPTTDGFAGWSGTQFTAFSSKDLVHWEDHGVILDLGPDITWADNSAWAPTIAQKNGKYYFYFSGGLATGDTRKQLGVAVADSPTGPFRDALGHPLVAAGAYSGQMIDSAVFTDDNGQSYLYWGNGNSYQVPLNADMVSFDPTKVRTYKPTGYNEGSFVFKRKGLYYFMWSENDTRSENYQVAYATSTSPLGPWSARRGAILQKNLALGIKGTGHNSVIRVPGTDDWYIVYHRFAIPNGDGTHRETTIDRMDFNRDGTIKNVVPTLGSICPVTIASPGDPRGSAPGAASSPS